MHISNEVKITFVVLGVLVIVIAVFFIANQRRKSIRAKFSQCLKKHKLSERTYEHAFNKFWKLEAGGFWESELRKRDVDNKSWVKFVNSKIGADIDAVISCFDAKRRF